MTSLLDMKSRHFLSLDMNCIKDAQKFCIQTQIEKGITSTYVFHSKREKMEPITFTHDLASRKKIKSPKIVSPTEMMSPQMNRDWQRITHTN